MIHYSQLEWICNNSTNLSIELDYYPSSATKIILDAAFLSSGNAGGLFGNFTNNTTMRYWANIYENYIMFNYGYNYRNYGGRDIRVDGNYRDDIRRTYEFALDHVAIDGTIMATVTRGIVGNYGYKLHLFGGVASWTAQATMKMSEFIIINQVYDESLQEYVDTTVHDYVPVIRWLDRKIGIYDKITENFYSIPTGYTRGKILDLDHYTKNLELMINFIDTTSTYQFINELSNNFKLFDSEFTTLKNKDLNLVALLANIERKFAIDATTKEAFWLNIRNKVDITEGKSTVLNTQIAKLSADYSRLELYELIATTNDLQTLIDAICATIMLDYYTKAEVDEIVAKGSGASMDNYYKKTEIDELIPQKEDLTIIDTFLQSREYYYNSVREFSRLNGKGE